MVDLVVCIEGLWPWSVLLLNVGEEGAEEMKSRRRARLETIPIPMRLA